MCYKTATLASYKILFVSHDHNKVILKLCQTQCNISVKYNWFHFNKDNLLHSNKGLVRLKSRYHEAKMIAKEYRDRNSWDLGWCQQRKWTLMELNKGKGPRPKIIGDLGSISSAIKFILNFQVCVIVLSSMTKHLYL